MRRRVLPRCASDGRAAVDVTLEFAGPERDALARRVAGSVAACGRYRALLHAGRVWRGLHSLSFRSTGIEPAVQREERWRIEAPGSVAYTVAGGGGRDHRWAPLGPLPGDTKWVESRRRRSRSPFRRGSRHRRLPARDDDRARSSRVEALVLRSDDARVVRHRARQRRCTRSTCGWSRRRTSCTTATAPSTAPRRSCAAPSLARNVRASRGRSAPTSPSSARPRPEIDRASRAAGKREKNWRRFSQKCSVFPRTEAGSTIVKCRARRASVSESGFIDAAADR